MAIQVRLDLSPQEFDLLRAALDTHKEHYLAIGNDQGQLPGARTEARKQVASAADLLRKVR